METGSAIEIFAAGRFRLWIHNTRPWIVKRAFRRAGAYVYLHLLGDPPAPTLGSADEHWEVIHYQRVSINLFTCWRPLFVNVNVLELNGSPDQLFVEETTLEARQRAAFALLRWLRLPISTELIHLVQRYDQIQSPTMKIFREVPDLGMSQVPAIQVCFRDEQMKNLVSYVQWFLSDDGDKPSDENS